MKYKLVYSIFIFSLVGLSSCSTHQLIHISEPDNKLFKVSILYANGEGKTFDMNYYKSNHMPMVSRYLGDNLKFYEIDKGISGRSPDTHVPYLAVGYFYIKDITAYQQAIGQHIETIVGDFKNYTNIQPVIQISEITEIGFNNEN